MGAEKYIFEGRFKFAASETRQYFEIKTSAVQREEDRYASPSTKKHQNLEVKLDNRVKQSMI